MPQGGEQSFKLTFPALSLRGQETPDKVLVLQTIHEALIFIFQIKNADFLFVNGLMLLLRFCALLFSFHVMRVFLYSLSVPGSTTLFNSCIPVCLTHDPQIF